MNEATRLMNLLVAICGDQIRDYGPQFEALARKLAKTGGAMRTRNIAFCKKHGVSLDWVPYGNLQDHPKKSWERKTVLTPDELRRAYESLGENDKAFISQYLSLLTKKDDAS